MEHSVTKMKNRLAGMNNRLNDTEEPHKWSES